LSEISKPIRRFVAVALLVAALLAAYGLVVGPVIDRYEALDAEIGALSDELVRFRSIAVRREALRERLDILADDGAMEALYMTGESDALIAAAIQDHLRAVIEANGAVIRSMRMLPSQDQGMFRRVGVSVQATVTTRALSDVLLSIEAEQPRLIIDGLHLSGAGRPGHAQVTNQPLPLSFTFEVRAYRRTPEGEQE